MTNTRYHFETWRRYYRNPYLIFMLLEATVKRFGMKQLSNARKILRDTNFDAL